MTYPIDLDVLPRGFERFGAEPVFDPSKHLALERPEVIYDLADLGYSAEEIASCPSSFGASSVFRVLSEEGVACLYDTVKRLEAFERSNARIQRCVRGGVYRSKFLQDLCLSPDIAAFMSDIAGIDLLPHTIPHQLGHLNYAPKEVGEDVDKWHVDTLRFDYVMFVTDPTQNEGGAFQYFKGTKHEIAALKAAGKAVPAEKIVAPAMPGAGYAVLQQGNMVVHQAKGLTAVGERVTMVNGYVTKDTRFPDYSRFDQLALIDPPEVIRAEYARHMAFQGKRIMDARLSEPGFDGEQGDVVAEFSKLSDMLVDAAQQIAHAGEGEVEHFGG